MPWHVERHEGPAQLLFHGLPEPLEPTVRALIVSAPTIVLGSGQRESVVVRDVGAAVVRRRSGGSAVWLDDDLHWIDVWLPNWSPRWHPDIHRSAIELGERLRPLIPSAEVHEGRLRSSSLSGLVCFCGVGPGELTVAGRKVVGISQRRTRAGTRLQVGVVRRWRPRALMHALGIDDPAARNEVENAASGIDDDPSGDGPDLAELLRAIVADG